MAKVVPEIGISEVAGLETFDHVIDANEETGPDVSRGRFYAIFATLCLVLSMNGLDINVIGDAAPAISVVFDTEHVAWLATIAFVTATGLVLPVGMIYARLEPKYVLLVSLVVFMLGEALSGSARTFKILMVGRFFVGVAFSSTATAAFLIVGLICQVTQQRAIYLSLVTALYGVMIKVGPLVAGGFLKISTNHWRWCFYIQLPLAVTCVLLILVLFPSFRSKKMINAQSNLKGSRMRDVCISTLTQAIFVLTLLLPCLLGGSSLAWNSGLLITCYVLVVPALTAFTYLECKSQDACRLVPIGRLVRDRSLGLLSIVTFCAILETFAVTYYLPIVVRGSTPIHAAVQILPLVISGTIGCIVVGKVVELTSQYFYSCVLGSAVQILGAGLFYSIRLHTSLTLIYIYQVILGLGCGCLTAIGLTIALHGVSKSDFPRIVAWIQFVLVLAAAIGIGIQGVILDVQIQAAKQQISTIIGGTDATKLTFSNFLIYLRSATSSDPIVIIGRAYVDTAQRYASLMYVVAGVISLAASLCMPRGRL